MKISFILITIVILFVNSCLVKDESIDPDESTMTISSERRFSSSIDIDSQQSSGQLSSSSVIVQEFCVIHPNQCGNLIDERDGQIYQTIRINNQNWMSEDLKYVTEESLCDEVNSTPCPYGLIYDGSTVTQNSTQGICPNGWDIPSEQDWNELFEHIAQEENVNSISPVWGTPLVAQFLKNSELWLNDSNSMNNFGFNAYPNNSLDALFEWNNESSNWWTSTPGRDENTYLFVKLESSRNEIVMRSLDAEQVFISIRCLQIFPPNYLSTQRTIDHEAGQFVLKKD